MNTKQSFDRTIFSPASLYGQGIAAAPLGVLCRAKYGACKTRNCGKPGFLRSKKWPQCGNRTESGGGISLSAKKTLSIQTEDSLRIRAKGSLNITSDKEVNLKGKNIKMSGTKGVTAENLQFRIDSGYIFGFHIKLSKYINNYAMGVASDNVNVDKFMEFEISKENISEYTKKTKFAYIPNLNYLPLIDKNNPFKYSLQNAFDGDISTSYVPKPCDEQIRLSINFDEKNVRQDYEITKIMIVNGYASSEELYKKNNRIKEVRYAYTKDKNPITFVLKETSKKQYVEVHNPRKETYFAFNVLSLYPGDSYNDTCFAEVNIFSKEYGWYFGNENE